MIKKIYIEILNNKYLYLIISLLIIQILAFIRNRYIGFFFFFWYCDFSPGIFAILFIFKKYQAINGLLNIGFFAQLAYLLILLYKLFFGISLFGFVFNFYNNFDLCVTLRLHISTLVIFFATCKFRSKPSSLLYSLIFLVLIYCIVLFFTNPSYDISENYNYIYYSSIISPYTKYYTQLWVLLSFTIVVLPTYFFKNIFCRALDKIILKKTPTKKIKQ